jgi:hypothetical protein
MHVGTLIDCSTQNLACELSEYTNSNTLKYDCSKPTNITIGLYTNHFIYQQSKISNVSIKQLNNTPCVLTYIDI